MTGLRVLVIDDERPALDEITFLLEHDERVAEVHATDSPTEALRLLQQLEVDAVFLDIQMPGLTGIELAQVLSRFKTPPVAVFVTAHEQHAVDAFELNAVDYVLKPVREDRLAEAVRRVLAATRTEHAEEQVPVERGGVTRLRADLADPLRRGRGRLRPAAHRRRRQPPRAGPAQPARAGVGRRRLRADPPVAADRDGVRRRGARRRRPVLGGDRRPRAPGQPAAHPRAARPPRPQREAGAEG